MEIRSVTSSLNAFTGVNGTQGQASQVQQSQQTQQGSQTEATRQAERREPRPEERVERTDYEPRFRFGLLPLDATPQAIPASFAFVAGTSLVLIGLGWWKLRSKQS